MRIFDGLTSLNLHSNEMVLRTTTDVMRSSALRSFIGFAYIAIEVSPMRKIEKAIEMQICFALLSVESLLIADFATAITSEECSKDTGDPLSSICCCYNCCRCGFCFDDVRCCSI